MVVIKKYRSRRILRIVDFKFMQIKKFKYLGSGDTEIRKYVGKKTKDTFQNLNEVIKKIE